MLTRSQIHDRLTDIGGEIKAAAEALDQADAAHKEQVRLAQIAFDGRAKAAERLDALIGERAGLAEDYVKRAMELGEPASVPAPIEVVWRVENGHGHGYVGDTCAQPD